MMILKSVPFTVYKALQVIHDHIPVMSVLSESLSEPVCYYLVELTTGIITAPC